MTALNGPALPGRPGLGRHRGTGNPSGRAVWERLVEPNPLWGANGIAFGPDGRLHVAQFVGGAISALDPVTGVPEDLVGPEGPLVAPDDLAFDADGAMYIVDLPPGVVWRRERTGRLRVVAEGITAPDGIACAGHRLFVNELCFDGRLVEIDLDGGAHRVLAKGLNLGNAMQVGPDGMLYYPHLLSGEVWRVALDGGAAERILTGVPAAVAVRFGPGGLLWALSCDGTGTLTSLDLRTGDRRSHQTGIPGPDNLAVDAAGRMFVSSAVCGGVVEVSTEGAVLREIVPHGLNGPFGIDVTPDGTLLVADLLSIARVGPDGVITRLGEMGRTIPSGIRGIVVARGQMQVATEGGQVHGGDPERGMRERVRGLAKPTGMLSEPDGGLLVTESGAGRVVHVGTGDRVTVLAEGLAEPVGLSRDVRGDVLVSDRQAGTIVRLRDRAVLASGLDCPEGIATLAGTTYCVEAGAGRLSALRPGKPESTEVVLENLPLAVLPEHVREFTPAAEVLSGRPAPVAALAVEGDHLIVGCSGDGGILRVRPSNRW